MSKRRNLETPSSVWRSSEAEWTVTSVQWDSSIVRSLPRQQKIDSWCDRISTVDRREDRQHLDPATNSEVEPTDRPASRSIQDPLHSYFSSLDDFGIGEIQWWSLVCFVKRTTKIVLIHFTRVLNHSLVRNQWIYFDGLPWFLRAMIDSNRTTMNDGGHSSMPTVDQWSDASLNGEQCRARRWMNRQTSIRESSDQVLDIVLCSHVDIEMQQIRLPTWSILPTGYFKGSIRDVENRWLKKNDLDVVLLEIIQFFDQTWKNIQRREIDESNTIRSDDLAGHRCRRHCYRETWGHWFHRSSPDDTRSVVHCCSNTTEDLLRPENRSMPW